MQIKYSLRRVLDLAFVILLLVGLRGDAWATQSDSEIDLVAVAVVGGGRAVVLATPGIPRGDRLWRLRSFDTSDLPQPIRDVSLSASGTKLMIQPASGPPVLVDLTSYRLSVTTLQYVRPHTRKGNGGVPTTHRLPGQRFVTVRDGRAYVVDDVGNVQLEYPVIKAAFGAISEDGVLLIVNGDGVPTVCGEAGDRRDCRELSWRVEPGPFSIRARAGHAGGHSLDARFVVVSGTSLASRVIGPDRPDLAGPPMRMAEAQLRATLQLEAMAVSETRIVRLVDTLLLEVTNTPALDQDAVTAWRFFRVWPDEHLYAPVLQFARQEMVFPGAFGTLENLGERRVLHRRDSTETVFEHYIRQSLDARRNQCTMYFRTQSGLGYWLIEYWLYYPFDVGGLGAHVHDPEHIFIAVDKLGSAVRKVIGAGHGYMAGNNIYNAAKPGAAPATLPLFALVELNKHATAPDMDRDGIFTPGLDENEYGERSKIWGVRDVVGTINNQLLAYDRTMTTSRRPEDYLAPASIETRFPHESDLVQAARCVLEPLETPAIDLSTCAYATTDCATRSVTHHPDFRDSRTILKQWMFPPSFLRTTYGVGPRLSLNRLGIGWAIDLDRMPGMKRLPLPGRLGADVLLWSQDPDTPRDKDGCVDHCDRAMGAGWEVRYEQFFANLFGAYSAVRVHTPPAGDAWIAFGPMVEIPLFDRSNVNVHAGVAFRPSASPRFELSVSVGLWKPKTNHVGIRVRKKEG